MLSDISDTSRITQPNSRRYPPSGSVTAGEGKRRPSQSKSHVIEEDLKQPVIQGFCPPLFFDLLSAVAVGEYMGYRSRPRGIQRISAESNGNEDSSRTKMRFCTIFHRSPSIHRRMLLWTGKRGASISDPVWESAFFPSADFFHVPLGRCFQRGESPCIHSEKIYTRKQKNHCSRRFGFQMCLR